MPFYIIWLLQKGGTSLVEGNHNRIYHFTSCFDTSSKEIVQFVHCLGANLLYTHWDLRKRTLSFFCGPNLTLLLNGSEMIRIEHMGHCENLYKGQHVNHGLTALMVPNCFLVFSVWHWRKILCRIDAKTFIAIPKNHAINSPLKRWLDDYVAYDMWIFFPTWSNIFPHGSSRCVSR